MAAKQALRKQKKYNWKDSNLALFGSKIEHEIKKESAEHEPAWQNAGKEVGRKIWRIVNFKVTDWPEEDYGKFYDGDSYIILNTYQKSGSEALFYDIHFWIGKYSTQDEYGTAAYKTVELATYLGRTCIQHREVQEHESKLFRKYFVAITYLQGGADSGFKPVKPHEYEPRLLHFHGDRRGVTVKEIPRDKSKLDSTDVHILDLGLTLYQWNGKGSNKDERVKAMQYLLELKEQRGGKPWSEVLDEESTEPDHVFYGYLDQKADDDDTEQTTCQVTSTYKELYRLSDESGDMTFSLEKTGSITITDFDNKDVFIFDTKVEVFVFIGKDTSANESKQAMTYAHNYLMKTDHPLIPISCILEDAIPAAPEFTAALAA